MNWRSIFVNCHHGSGAFPARVAYPFPMHYVLGFDGGSTKTGCVLMDEAAARMAPHLILHGEPAGK